MAVTRYIKTQRGEIDKISSLLGVDRKTVYNALNYKVQSRLAGKIRKIARQRGAQEFVMK